MRLAYCSSIENVVYSSSDPTSAKLPSFVDHLRPRPFIRDRAILTGRPMRDPIEYAMEIVDPVSNEHSTVMVYHYPTRNLPQPAGSILAVHGFRGDHHGLELLIDSLPHLEFWVPDLPGFGRSPALPSAQHSVSDFAHVLNQVRDRLPAEISRPQWLLGHSFGSLIASYLAAQQPESWQGLVLLNPISRPALDPSGPLAQRLMTRATEIFYQLAALLPRALAESTLSNSVMVWATGAVMGKYPDPNIIGYTHQQHQQYFSAFDSPTSLLQAYQASISTTVHEVAEQLPESVLLVAGENDELATAEEQQHLAKHIARNSPRVTLEIIPQTGHLMHYETPTEIAHRLDAFMGHRC